MAQGNLAGNTLIYPKGINAVPFASCMEITKYSYKAGLERAKNDSDRNDVFSALTRSGIGEAAVNTIRGAGLFLFND